mmetsp:Transcript_50996/g.128692  ORF Transcript_50996/g.128692 Transcript_50996/m.128692 type:complete len:190 (-) Transcript_50996:197-766(-)
MASTGSPKNRMTIARSCGGASLASSSRRSSSRLVLATLRTISPRGRRTTRPCCFFLSLMLIPFGIGNVVDKFTKKQEDRNARVQRDLFGSIVSVIFLSLATGGTVDKFTNRQEDYVPVQRIITMAMHTKDPFGFFVPVIFILPGTGNIVDKFTKKLEGYNAQDLFGCSLAVTHFVWQWQWHRRVHQKTG